MLASTPGACVVCGTTKNTNEYANSSSADAPTDDHVVTLCHQHHRAIAARGHPYTVFFALADPFVELLDNIVASRGYDNRAEAVSRALIEFATPQDTSAANYDHCRETLDSRYWSPHPRPNVRVRRNDDDDWEDA